MAQKKSPKKSKAKARSKKAPKKADLKGSAANVNLPKPATEAEHDSEFPPTIPGKCFAVTTMNMDGLQRYGQQFLATFARFWPKQVTLLAFSEGWAAADVECDLPDSIRVHELSAGYKEPDGGVEYGVYLRFLQMFSTDTAANGWILQKNKKAPVYVYRLDAVRFCHKVYALHKALKMALDEGAEYLFWVDADIITHTKIPLKFLQDYLPPARDLGYLHRQAQDGSPMYPECGFVIYRISRPICRLFLDLFRQSYDSGDIFKLPEWHDSFIFLVLMQGMIQEKGLKANSISRGGEDTWHPFVNSPLAQYMDHMKGPERKESGSSAKADLKDPKDAVAYFQGVPAKLSDSPPSPVLPSRATANMENPDEALDEPVPEQIAPKAEAQ